MPGTGILRPRLADGMRRLAGVRALPVLVLICLSLPVAAQPLRYLSGEHYQPLETPVTHAEDGRIHVVEFFLRSEERRVGEEGRASGAAYLERRGETETHGRRQ